MVKALNIDIVFNPETGKFDILDKTVKPVRYCGVNTHKFVIVTDTEEEAETFLKENGGGKLYKFVYYQHNDEVLPQSKFVKEVNNA